MAAYFASANWRFPSEEAHFPPRKHTSSIFKSTALESPRREMLAETSPTTAGAPVTAEARYPTQESSLPPLDSHLYSQSSTSTIPPDQFEFLESNSRPKDCQTNIDSQSRPVSTNTSSRLFPPNPLVPMEIKEKDDSNFMDDDGYSSWLAQQHWEEMRRSYTAPATKRVARRRPSPLLPRNAPIKYPLLDLKEYTQNGIRLSPKVCVELHDGDFMKIVHIVEDVSTLEITLRGYIFRRNNEMNGLLPRKLNEICWILQIDGDDPRDPLLQGVETRAITEVLRRRSLRLTNRDFPALSFRDDKSKDSQDIVLNERVLVCRYKYVCLYLNPKARTSWTWSEKSLHRLQAEECDKRADNKMVDDDLRRAWRGSTLLGGAMEGWLPAEREFLRQEAISHKGITSIQSLKAAGGPDFAPRDPMKRGCVGSLLSKFNLPGDHNKCSKPADYLDSRQTSMATGVKRERSRHGANENVPAIYRSLSQRHQANSISTSDEPTTDSSEEDADVDLRGLNFNGGLGAPSGESPRNLHLQITDINTRVKITSPSGILRKHYKGRITSTYTPSPWTQRRLSSERRFESFTRPPKRTRLDKLSLHNSDEESGAGNNIKFENRDTDSADGGRLMKRSLLRSSAEDLCAPAKPSKYKDEEPVMLNPSSTRPDDVHHLLGLGERKGTRVESTRRFARAMDLDDVIDLTSPQVRAFPAGRKCLSRLSVSGKTNAPPFSEESLSPRNTPYLWQPPPSRRLDAARSLASPASLQLTGSGSMESSSQVKSETRAKHEESMQRTPTTKQPIQIKPEIKTTREARSRRYTFGDCFCGAGGMSRGAVSAGLRIAWGFDFDIKACRTYASNFFGTAVYNVWANEFAAASGYYQVDICHLSPPCQYFSPAHTHQGKNDEMNTASLFAISKLLEKAKPRVVTLEQTPGLIRRHPIYFNAVVNMLTSLAFSVRWKIINCADFGLPQRRIRLFIIASW